MEQKNGISPPSRPCIVVVEDDSSVRRSLQLLLRSHGFDVRAYASAQQAGSDPDMGAAECLIADMVMPDVDGIALLQTLRARGWKGPAILISAYFTEATRSRASEVGFEGLLAKPFADGKLVELVKGLTHRPALGPA